MPEDQFPCPDCGSLLEFDEVDLGVGFVRGNPRCPDCGWKPPDPYDGLDDVDDADAA
jgi:DNA-directed RNA polymerase subunit RPC12/RpoP